MFLSQVLNGVLLPFILIFMIRLVNNKDIMGEYTNSKVFNIVTWFVVVPHDCIHNNHVRDGFV